MKRNYLKEDFIDNEDAIETIEETSSSDDYSDINSAEWYSSCYDSDKNFNVMFNVLFNASGSFAKDSSVTKIKPEIKENIIALTVFSLNALQRNVLMAVEPKTRAKNIRSATAVLIHIPSKRPHSSIFFCIR